MNKNSLIIIIGAYGSGKSEYAINLAKQTYYSLNKETDDRSISLIDLDIVNPYFRSRDVKEEFEKEGIEVVAPESKFHSADMPMLSPMIKGTILNKEKTVIIDVGGDPVGCRALARFEDDIKKREYTMQFVVNTKRPFTSNKEETIKMKNMLEYTSKLKVSEVICNTNLMELTDEKLINEGIEIIREVAKSEGLLFEKYIVLDDKDNRYPKEISGIKRVNIEYFLRKPWE